MLQRNLLYTGVTRAKELVIVVGQDKAMRAAVRSVSQARRTTRLRHLISNSAAQASLGASAALAGD
jgi:exodeoxyribonuclease V alpha subunit